MPAVARLEDAVFSATGNGYKCRSPKTIKIASASSRVYCDTIGVARKDDVVDAHSKAGCDPDNDLKIKSSSRVYVEGRNAARIGDKAESDNTIIQGSTRVFFG